MSDLHRRQVAGTKHGHGIADSDETVAVCRHNAGEFPATALKVFLEYDCVGYSEMLADVRTRVVETRELSGGLSQVMHRVGRQYLLSCDVAGLSFSTQ